MKLDENTVGPAAQKIATQWHLTLGERIAETGRAYVFKVDGPDGAGALKLYKRLGGGGEGAGIHFLRALPPDLGVHIRRNSVWRSAVLMEWLDGPTLERLLEDGQDARATQLLADVARAMHDTPFRWPFIYRRLTPGLKRDYATCTRMDLQAPVRHDLDRCIKLLDHLIATTDKERVIHGDLGFGNVMLTPNGPRVIDPKGFRADPAFDLAKALIMPYDRQPLPAFIARINDRGPVLAAAIGTGQLRLMQWAAIILGHKAIYGARKRPEERSLLPYLTTLLDLCDA